MKLKHTKLMLASAVVAVAMPATFVLSQDRQDPSARDRQENRVDGMLRDEQSPEHSKQMAEKWFKHTASANQFEIEVARLALERFGGQPQPGMQGDQQRQPGAGGGMGQQPGGMADRSEPDQGQDQDRARPVGGQMDRQQDQPVGMQQIPVNQRDQLRQIAQTMEQDHRQALEKLRELAQQAGVQISQTPELEPVHRAKLEDLRQKHGEEFARCFVFGNMAGHTYAILELNWAQNDAPSEHIKEYARATLPKIQQHAHQIAPIAYEIAGVSEARTAGERMGQEHRDQPQRDSDRGMDRGAGQERPGGGSGGSGDRPDGM